MDAFEDLAEEYHNDKTCKNRALLGCIVYARKYLNPEVAADELATLRARVAELEAMREKLLSRFAEIADDNEYSDGWAALIELYEIARMKGGK